MSETDIRTTAAPPGAERPLTPAPTPHNVPLVFTSLLLGMLIVSLGQMIFATALPTIVADLGGAPDHFIACVGTAGSSTGVARAHLVVVEQSGGHPGTHVSEVRGVLTLDDVVRRLLPVTSA